MLLAPLWRHASERGHRCQPYRGFDDGNGWYPDGFMADPEFPLRYKRDPWCWSPELGFPRSRTPNVPHRLTGLTGRKFVSNKGLQMWQALRLGAGWGISSEPCDDGHWPNRPGGSSKPSAAGGAETWSRSPGSAGWSAATSTAAARRIADDDAFLTGWFRDAILEFLPHPGLGEWNDVLLRACHGPGAPATWLPRSRPGGRPHPGPGTVAAVTGSCPGARRLVGGRRRGRS